MVAFLKKSGITFATFRVFGKIPVDNIWLIISVSGLHISFLHALSNLVEIPSCPQVGLDLRLFKCSMVVSSDIGSNRKLCVAGFKS